MILLLTEGQVSDYRGAASVLPDLPDAEVLIADKGTKGTSNLLNFNVAEGVKLELPNQFWTRLQSTFGTTFFVKEQGEDAAVVRAVDTIDFCLREGFCVDVPPQFKDAGKSASASKNFDALGFEVPKEKGIGLFGL